MKNATQTFRKTLAAVMVLGLFGSLCPTMPSATSIIVSRKWTASKAITLIAYRLAVVAFSTWIGWI